VIRASVKALCRELMEAEVSERAELCERRPGTGRGTATATALAVLRPATQKARAGGRVARKRLVVAHAAHDTGRREIIGLDVGEAETEAFGREFLRSFAASGLVGVRLAVSDAHPGLKVPRFALAKLRSTNPLSRRGWGGRGRSAGERCFDGDYRRQGRVHRPRPAGKGVSAQRALARRFAQFARKGSDPS
jgi:hypothetical protein